jgi:hypothetical protein
MDRDPEERVARIQRSTREACAALRSIFGAHDLGEELERIGHAEEMLERLRHDLDELEGESTA